MGVAKVAVIAPRDEPSRPGRFRNVWPSSTLSSERQAGVCRETAQIAKRGRLERQSRRGGRVRIAANGPGSNPRDTSTLPGLLQSLQTRPPLALNPSLSEEENRIHQMALGRVGNDIPLVDHDDLGS